MIEFDELPTAVGGRVDWKHYFKKVAKIGDQFIVPKSMRSGIQRQAAENGYSAKSAAAGHGQLCITVCELDTVSHLILESLGTLSEKHLIQIHKGCVQAKILAPLF
jgi:hypothetical protein